MYDPDAVAADSLMWPPWAAGRTYFRPKLSPLTSLPAPSPKKESAIIRFSPSPTHATWRPRSDIAAPPLSDIPYPKASQNLKCSGVTEFASGPLNAVRISHPFSVTARVCSNWADHL